MEEGFGDRKRGSLEMKLKRIVFAALGCICLALGTLGVFLPVLPTTPFFIATVFFFANSSERLHTWFIGTRLYKKHLEDFVKKRGMKPSTKVSVILTVTVLMGFGFFMMARKGVWIPCIVLGAVWCAHLVYFVFFVKTIAPDTRRSNEIMMKGSDDDD